MTLSTLLRQRSLIRLAGSGQMKLLQGLTTNDCMKFESDEDQKIMYANWLSNKGRVWFDLFIYKYQDHYLLELDSVYKNKLLLMLKLHNLEKQVLVEGTKLEVGHTNEIITDAVESSDSVHDDVSKTLFADPRVKNFGHRVISENLNFEDFGENYTHERYLNGIAEGCGEIKHDKSLPLCFNLDWQNGVSFTKGCYLGQELTQRTHFTGLVSKRVLPIQGVVPDSFTKGRRPAVEIINKSPIDANLKLAMVRLDRLTELEKSDGVDVLWQDWMRFDEKI